MTNVIWSRVDPEIRGLAQKLADFKGITLSEYIRQLILEDLDKRTVFTSKLKQNLPRAQGVDRQAQAPRAQSHTEGKVAELAPKRKVSLLFEGARREGGERSAENHPH